MTYKYEVELLGRKLEMTDEPKTQVPLESFAWRSTSEPFPMTGSTTLESAEEGTHVIDTIQAEPDAFFKLAGPVLITNTRTDIERFEEIERALGEMNQRGGEEPISLEFIMRTTTLILLRYQSSIIKWLFEVSFPREPLLGSLRRRRS
ncbi:MAG: hypothetical protein A2030_11935 [Chloroflexi bacterium RBG_19FT_COMBO_50_10]|nr:MAG: hypothetical protein A2030_11935 [Chloroflexi bacterium RBG_19FT_COMBO_50_10]